MVTQVQILVEIVCISHNTNTLGKDMCPTILSPAMSNIVEHTELFNLGMATGQGEGTLWI